MLEHKHIIIRAEVSNPPFDVTQITIWLKKLVDNLGMKIMMGPMAGYSPVVGNRGLTAAVVIETSHIVLHAWDEEDPAMLQLDVYTCSHLDKQVVLDAIQQFEPTHVDYKILDRESKFITILEKSS
ncbi:MAG: S-adenosylmethionine decarboxylase [Hymenobacter sp.]|nr:MAG: S-adenosylmethionine decarboxylase [Hymenobacter sp.]